MEKKRVYLGGPINKCSDAEAKDWRELAKLRLGSKFELLDPMVRDYRGRELEPGNAHEIATNDENDFGSCDVGLFYCPKPSVGTSMEIRDMHKWLKRLVVIVCPEPMPSPWLIVNNTRIFKDFPEAFAYLEAL